MKLIGKLVLFSALLLLVNLTSRTTLTTNQLNGVYPANADSIGIPLAETASLSVVGAILLAALLALSSLSRAYRQGSRPRPWFIASVASLALAYLLTFTFFALWGMSWFIPHHFSIAASCALVFGVVLWLAVADYRSLRPNISFKPNPLRGSA